MEKRILTKEDIIRGTKRTEKIYFKELGGEIEIRPLNEEQWAEIEGKSGSIIEADFDPVKDDKGNLDWEKTQENVKMRANMEKATRLEFEQSLLACKYGMVMDISEEELRNLSPPGLLKKIAKEVFKISSVSEDQLDELKSFRKK